MAGKQLNARIVTKHDIEFNWNKAINFIPKKGEIIVYDADSENSISRIKIGNGITNIKNLQFITDNYVLKENNKGLSTLDFTQELYDKLSSLEILKVSSDSNFGIAKNDQNELLNLGILNLQNVNNKIKYTKIKEGKVLEEDLISFGDLANKNLEEILTSFNFELIEENNGGNFIFKYGNEIRKEIDFKRMMQVYVTQGENDPFMIDEELKLPKHVQLVYHDGRFYQHFYNEVQNDNETSIQTKHEYNVLYQNFHYHIRKSNNGLEDELPNLPDFVNLVLVKSELTGTFSLYLHQKNGENSIYDLLLTFSKPENENYFLTEGYFSNNITE